MIIQFILSRRILIDFKPEKYREKEVLIIILRKFKNQIYFSNWEVNDDI